MKNCPACQATLDESSLTAGRCAYCGAEIRKIPHRSIQEIKQPVEDDAAELDELNVDESASEDELATIDLDELDLNELSEQEELGNTDDIQTIEFASEEHVELELTDDLAEGGDESATVEFSGEATVEFSQDSDPENSEDDVSESMVTAQWLDNVAESQSDPEATIRQKETITETFVSKSSLVVKSRHFRSEEESDQPIGSPADAPDYELLNMLGEGGMGVVYAARQSAIARTVAVKMLKQGNGQTSEQREKFISEAVITGELEHPNIVPIYDLGANDAGALFYSMKRVKGTPWDDAIKEKSLDENLNILLRVADAVAFAHANGVLHRDLKPENVMLGDYGEVLVMDWGLARISPEFPNADSVIQSDVMGGTPAYMAPEMATGPIDEITIRSDVYLLGAILYEIITGRPPHTGKTVMACLFSAAKNKIVATDHEGELMDVALQAMASKPDDRFESVKLMQDAIRRYQSHSESVLLTESAEKSLASAKEADDYELFSRALYGFQEAITLWEGNERAKSELSATQVAYATSALKKSDFDLGISLLDSSNPEHKEVLEKLETGRRERESRNRKLKLLKGAVAALVLAVIGIVSVAYFAVSTERDKAIVARNEAVESEKVAVAAEKVAVKAQKEEEIAKDEALEAKAKEEAERKKAEEAAEQERLAKLEAEAAEERALEAKELETQAKEKETIAKEAAVKAQGIAEAAEAVARKAKEAEEYEAYVARIGFADAKIEENSFDRALELLDECSEGLRNWEWGRLAYLCQLSDRTWDLAGPVETVAFSPDGTLFASGDYEGQLRLWDFGTGEEIFAIDHGQYVHTVAFDPAGQRLATASSNRAGSDHTIRIYSVEDGELLQTLEGHDDAVLSVRFSSDGKTLLSAGYDNTARLWNLDSGETIQILGEHSWWVWAAEFSPDDQRIVTASQDGKAMVWQKSPSGNSQYELVTEFTKHRGPIYSAKFSSDGTSIATAGDDRRVLLWSPDEVKPIDIANRLDGLKDPPAPFRELAMHEGPVRSIAFSPDGSQLVSGGQDNVLRVWNFSSGREMAVLRGHASHVRDCTFSHDGKWIISAGRDRQIKLWQPGLYTESLVLGRNASSGHEDAVLAARFSRDGKQIVTASRDRTAAIWDVNSQDLVKKFSEGHDFLASSVQFFPRGDRLATGGGDGTTRIWDVATRTQLLEIPSTGRTAAIAVSDDGQLIVTGSEGNNAIVWDAQTGKQISVLEGHEAVVTAARFSPDSQLVATGDDRGHCRLWKREGDEWNASAKLDGHSRSITSMRFTPDGSKLVTSSGDNTCGQWDVAAGKELSELVLKHPKWVSDMDLSPDGKQAFTYCDDGLLRLWSLDDAKVVRTIDPKSDAVFTSVDLSPDGKLAMAVCAAKGTVRIWQLESGEEIRSGDEAWKDFRRDGVTWAARFSPDGKNVLTIGGNDARLWDLSSRESLGRFNPHGTVASADISPDGNLLATGSWDQSVKIWSIESGLAIRKLEGEHQGYVNSVEFSPDGGLILTASDDGTARLWDAAAGEALDTVFAGHDSRVRQARFSSDGSQVLTVAHDKTGRIWDAASGELKQTLSGHQWAVLCGEFSSDGQRVVTGSEDNTAIIWDSSSGEFLLKLAGHTDGITAVAFSPDGSRVLTGSEDNSVKVWDARTGKELLTLLGHEKEITSVGFSPDGRLALTSSRDGATILWPTIDVE